MNVFDKLWSRDKGLPKGDLADSSDKPVFKVNATQQLKDIFYERKHGEYVGGTLSFEVNDKLVLKIMGRGINGEENFWIAMNYVKYRPNNSFHYQEALDLIINRDDMKEEVAKLLLMR